MLTGLVADARNAEATSNAEQLRVVREVLSGPEQQMLPSQRTIIQPVEPKGASSLAAVKYAGRALAEWSIVVNECNSFVDRRRDEGQLGLKEVEVPSLGVEANKRAF